MRWRDSNSSDCFVIRCHYFYAIEYFGIQSLHFYATDNFLWHREAPFLFQWSFHQSGVINCKRLTDVLFKKERNIRQRDWRWVIKFLPILVLTWNSIKNDMNPKTSKSVLLRCSNGLLNSMRLTTVQLLKCIFPVGSTDFIWFETVKNGSKIFENAQVRQVFQKCPETDMKCPKNHRKHQKTSWNHFFRTFYKILFGKIWSNPVETSLDRIRVNLEFFRNLEYWDLEGSISGFFGFLRFLDFERFSIEESFIHN